MKKIVVTSLILVIGSIMTVILMFHLLTLKKDAMVRMEKNAALVIRQIETILEENTGETSWKEETGYLLEQMPVTEGMEYLVAEKEELQILGATSPIALSVKVPELLGQTVRDFVAGEVGKYETEKEAGYYFFEETDRCYIGILQPESFVFASLGHHIGRMIVSLFLAAGVIILVSLWILDRYIIRDVNRMVEGVKKIQDGDMDFRIEVTGTPELKLLSDNLNQMTENLLIQTGKISRILNAVDMLLAVYEYGNESDKVVASERIGAVLMMSEEEIQELMENKNLFQQKIDNIKQYPVEGVKHVYQLEVETECYLKIETFRKQQTEYGIIMDVTEEIVEKQRLQRERDYDVLTGLLARRAFYQKMEDLCRRQSIVKHAVLMMCDLDGLKQFNDTYGHANGDKAIQKAAEIMNSVRTPNKYVARLSGDEFAVFIYGEESDEALEVKIQEMYQYMMQSKIMVFHQEVPVRLSGGYVYYSKYPETLDKLLKMADIGMYQSKENGRARFTEYQEK